MTAPKPKSPTMPSDAAIGRKDAQDDAPRIEEVAPRPDIDQTGLGAEMEELSRTRDEAEDRARELLAAEVLQSPATDPTTSGHGSWSWPFAVTCSWSCGNRSRRRPAGSWRPLLTAARTPSSASSRA